LRDFQVGFDGAGQGTKDEKQNGRIEQVVHFGFPLWLC